MTSEETKGRSPGVGVECVRSCGLMDCSSRSSRSERIDAPHPQARDIGPMTRSLGPCLLLHTVQGFDQTLQWKLSLR